MAEAEATSLEYWYRRQHGLPRNDPRLAALSGYELEHEYRVYLAYRETGARLRLLERHSETLAQQNLVKSAEHDTRREKIAADLRALADEEKAALQAQYGGGWLGIVTEMELAESDAAAPSDATTDSELSLDELAALISDSPLPEEFARRVREAEAKRAAK